MKHPKILFFNRKSDYYQVPDNLLLPKQSHSSKVAVVTRSNEISNADALVTKSQDIAIGVKTADCVPIMLYDTTSEIVGVIHAGWKGLINEVIENTIQSMIDNRADVRNIKVVIGPSIGPCCYPIFGDRKSLFEQKFKNNSDQIFVEKKGNINLDLQACSRIELQRLGVLSRNIDMSYFECTACNSYKFDSYFRDGKCGKQILSIISLE